MAEFINVNPADIQPGPIRHSTFSAEILEKLKLLYEAVGHYICNTLEEWEIGFMRDANPEREIDVWVRIALGWEKYHEKYHESRILADEIEQELVGLLIGMSMGVLKEEELLRSPQASVYDQLLECYKDPLHDRKDY